MNKRTMKTGKARAAELHKGLRLDIRKAPKIEVPKSVYTRKGKHSKRFGADDE
jgi:hypothetical protein